MNKALYITLSNDKFGYVKSTDGFELNFQSCLFIDVESNTGKSATEYHANPIYHCHYVLKGSCEFGLSNGCRRRVDENQFIIIPRGEKHCILNESPDFSKIRIVFDIEIKRNTCKEFYKNFEKGLQKFEVYDFNDNIGFILGMLIKNNDEKTFDYGNLGESCSYALILETADVIVEGGHSLSNGGKNDNRVEKAMDFITKNVSRPICVTDAAKHVSLSEKQLTRLFTEYKNYTPAEYIRFTKFNLAVKLLLDTDMSVGEIAEKTGFNSISGFVNFFVRIEKQTPTQYRRRMRIYKKTH